MGSRVEPVDVSEVRLPFPNRLVEQIRIRQCPSGCFRRPKRISVPKGRVRGSPIIAPVHIRELIRVEGRTPSSGGMGCLENLLFAARTDRQRRNVLALASFSIERHG